MSSALVSIKDLDVQIGGRQILHGVDLSVPRGRTLGIVGETGSGKSMTCRALLGTLNRVGARHTGGSLKFDGIDLTKLDQAGWRKVRGRRIGLVPQASMSGLDPMMKVGKHLTHSVRDLEGVSRAEANERSLELLELVGLPRPDEVAGHYAHQLSGGMRQRVMIALALIGRPELLVADEPTTALDVTIQRGILDLLAALVRDTNMALVLVSHDLAVVESVTETVAVMYAGRVVETGTTREVLKAPAHPYTAALLASQPSRSLRGQRLPTLPSGVVSAQIAVGCPFASRCERAHPRCLINAPGRTALTDSHGAWCWALEESS